MPLEDSYMDQLKSPVADLKNAGGRLGGSITAALFLKEFVKTDKAGAGAWAGLPSAFAVYIVSVVLLRFSASSAGVWGGRLALEGCRDLEAWSPGAAAEMGAAAHPPLLTRPPPLPHPAVCRCSGATWTLRGRCGGRRRAAPPALARSCWLSGRLARASSERKRRARASATSVQLRPEQPISLQPPVYHFDPDNPFQHVRQERVRL